MSDEYAHPRFTARIEPSPRFEAETGTVDEYGGFGRVFGRGFGE